MAKRRLFAAAPSTILSFALLASPVAAIVAAPTPAPSATPAATLAPIDDGSQPDSSASTAPGQPKLLGHIYTSAFCRDFVERFNSATTVIVSNDRHFDTIDKTLHGIEDDWNRRDGASRVYADRNQLIADVGAMQNAIPLSQKAINALLAQAKASTDSQRKSALQEAASQLQRTLDRQRAVAYDLTSVIHVLMDKHTVQDTMDYQIQELAPEGLIVNLHPGDDPVPEPGVDTLMQPRDTPAPRPGASATPGPSPTPAQVEDMLQWDRQRGVMSDAESKAASAASTVIRICDDEHVPTPPPAAGSILPSAAPSPSPSS